MIRKLLLVALFSTVGCVSHLTEALEREAQTLHSSDMEAAIRAARPGEPRCDEACRRASSDAART